MDKTTQLEKRIEELEKKLVSLETSSGVPDNLVKSLAGRGFLKPQAPAIFVIGADQGAWLNTGGGSDLAFPPAFAPITQGDFAGFWIPLYIPPPSHL